MVLSKRIRDLRYAKGWGPDDLANRAKISRTALYHIESGKTENPQAGTLRRVARALGISIEELLALPTAGAAERKAVPNGDGHGLPPVHVRDLVAKLQALLASPMAEGVARIVEESYRLLPADEGPATTPIPQRPRERLARASG